MDLDDDFLKASAIGDDAIDMIAWADPDPVIAVINFSSMNPGKYERWSWFRNSDLPYAAVYISLKDEDQHYYLGTPAKPLAARRQAMIETVLARHAMPPDKVIAIGSSMGGNAALRYGFTMGFGAVITINPQVDLESAKLHSSDLWSRKMLEADWRDLDLAVRGAMHAPAVLLRFGAYDADRNAALRLKAAFDSRNVRYRIELDESLEHGWAGMKATRLLDLVGRFSSVGPSAVLG